ncbi:MAG TPA: hypothetical protein VG276_19360 [Actinomycetes bacterium]|nr:hypothetical protein [Actinomycetes bacterium]
MHHLPTEKALATLAVGFALGLVALLVLPTTAAAQESPTTTEPPATAPPTTEPPATEPPATTPPTTEPPATAPPTTEPPATAPPTTEPPATEPPATTPPTTEPPATTPPTAAPPTTVPPPSTIVSGTTGPALPPNAVTSTTRSGALPPGTSGGSGSATGGSSGSPGAGSGPDGPGGGISLSKAEPVAFILGPAKPVVDRLLGTAKPVVERLLPKTLVRRLARTDPVAATGQAARLVASEVGELEPVAVAGYVWLALAAFLTTLAACTSLWWAPRGWPTARGLALTAHRRTPRRGWPPLGGADGRHLPGRHLPGRAGPDSSEVRQLRSIGIDVEALRATPPLARPVFSTRDDHAAPEH